MLGWLKDGRRLGCCRPPKRCLLGGLRRQVARGKTHPLGDANTVVRVGTVEMRDLPLDDLNRHAVHGRSYVFEKLLLLQRRHQAEQVAGLAVIVISIAMTVTIHVAQIGARMPLLGVDEIGEFQAIADEEHRRVVADDVSIALLGIEAQCKAAHVALRIRSTRPPATVERRKKASVFLPTCESAAALVYLAMSLVTVSVP